MADTRNVTVTFDDGTSHKYNGVPKDVSPDAIHTRAEKEFSGKKVKAIAGDSGPTSSETKAEPSLIDRATSVGKEALTSGIYGTFAPEMMMATGGALQTLGGGIPGPVGRGSALVGGALTAGGEAIKAYRPAATAAGFVGGAIGETAGQAVESKYGPGVTAETARLLGSTVGPVPFEMLGTSAGKLLGRTLSFVPGMRTARTLADFLQERGIAASEVENLSTQTKKALEEKITQLRGGGDKSRQAEKDIMGLFKESAQKITGTAEQQALGLEKQAKQQSELFVQQAQDKAQRIRQNALSQSPSVRQIAEVEAKGVLDKAQQEAQRIIADAKQKAVQLRGQSGKLLTKSEAESQKAKSAIKTVGEDKELTDIFEPVQAKSIERQQKFIDDRNALDKDLRKAQQDIVKANESKGVTLDAMPSYKSVDQLTKPFDVATSPTIVKNTDPGVLSFYKRIRDSVLNKTYELSPSQAQIAKNLGYKVQEMPGMEGAEPRYFRTFNSSFEALDDARRFVGEVFKNPTAGYEAVKGIKEQNMYELLSKLQQEYVGAAEQKALQSNWANASKNLEQFETKSGRALTEIEEGTSHTTKAPAELATRFFKDRTGVQQLIDLTGDERLVNKTAADYAVNSLKNLDAKAARGWLNNARNSDFLSHPSLSNVKSKLESYVSNLERAEKFGGARESLASKLKTEAGALPIKAAQTSERLLTEAPAKAQAAKEKQLSAGVKQLLGQRGLAQSTVQKAQAQAPKAGEPLLKEAQAVRSEADKKVNTLLANTTDESRLEQILLGTNAKEWELMAPIIRSTPGAKEKLAEGVGQIVARAAEISLKGARAKMDGLGERLVDFGVMDKAAVNNIKSKLDDILLTPVSAQEKTTMIQRLMRNALVGYFGAIPPRAAQAVADIQDKK